MVMQMNTQWTQEQAKDPLLDMDVDQLESTMVGLEEASKKLESEASVGFDSVDMSSYEVGELETMSSAVREASRKFAIALAAGPDHFQGQGKDDVESIKNLQPYIAPEVIKDLNVPVLEQVVATQRRYECILRSSPIIDQSTADFKLEETSADTMKKLANHFAELGKHCEKISNDRSKSAKQKGKKETIKTALKKKLGSLMPMLRRHVLRAGIGKGQHLNMYTNVSAIKELFSYEAVEEAHRQMEDGRDRIMQELTLRKLEAKRESSPDSS